MQVDSKLCNSEVEKMMMVEEVMMVEKVMMVTMRTCSICLVTLLEQWSRARLRVGVEFRGVKYKSEEVTSLLSLPPDPTAPTTRLDNMIFEVFPKLAMMFDK